MPSVNEPTVPISVLIKELKQIKREHGDMALPFRIPREWQAMAGGGRLFTFRFVDINRDLKVYAPGCGADTFVEGTNGGQMPCGGRLTDLAGNTRQYFCAACEKELNGKIH